MYKNATKCNKTQSKWCINKHGASKIIDTFEMYQRPPPSILANPSTGYKPANNTEGDKTYNQPGIDGSKMMPPRR
jgi:hypothetical protein